MLLGGLAAFLLTVTWVRTRALREKYAVVWLAVAALLLLCGLFPHALEALATASHLSYPSAVLFVALAVMYVFSFGVSVSLTRQHRRNVRLTQELAILEHRLRQLEARVADRPMPSPARDHRELPPPSGPAETLCETVSRFSSAPGTPPAFPGRSAPS
jgi:hypothetical protein